MREAENVRSISYLNPDYMGFIFYAGSPRNSIGIDKEIVKSLSNDVTPVGVFVNSNLKDLFELTEYYDISTLQLHGNESPEYCQELKTNGFQIIKAISIPENACDDIFNDLDKYSGKVDMFLFDTKGKSQGGNGFKFDWEILNSYKGNIPYILSGGIEKDDADYMSKSLPDKCVGVDINSKFEISPGLKDVKLVKLFIEGIRNGKE